MGNQECSLDKLDRLSAELIMGWSHGVSFWMDKHALPYTLSGWQPTRNIAQAWECLQKVDMFEISVVGTFMGWRCTMQTQKEFESFPGSHQTITVNYYPTAPEAIVRACLKAKGVDID